jgi:hypothetical protein
MPEMKTLNGFEIVDAQAREDIEVLKNTEVDLSEYAKKSEIPDVSDFITNIPSEYITETELNAKGYLTKHQSLAGLATEKYVDDAIDAIPAIDLTPYAKKTDIPDVSVFAKKTDIPDVSGFITDIPSEYITEAELNAKGYLTKHQSLAGYATEAFVTNKIAEAKLEGEGEPIDLSGYATKDDIRGFITEIPSEYVTESELATKGYLTEHQDLSGYAKKSEIPDVSNFITEVPEEYITETELNAKGYLTKHQSLAGLATEKYVDDAIDAIPAPDLSGITQDINELEADATTLRARVTTLESNSSDYLTSIPSEYITETELNNKGYITASSVASSYYPKSSGQANAAAIAAINSNYASTSYVDEAVANIPGVMTLYQHNILIHDGSNTWKGFYLTIISTKSDKYTFETLWDYMYSQNGTLPCCTYLKVSGSSVPEIYIAVQTTGSKGSSSRGFQLIGSGTKTFGLTDMQIVDSVKVIQ